MRILILGSNGFIGKNLVSHLERQNIDLILFDRNNTPEYSSHNKKCISGDFSDTQLLEAIFLYNKITHVVHLISTTLPKSSNENKTYDISSNVIQTIKLLDLCVKHKIKKFIFMSSGGAIYGIPKYTPIDEEHPTNPICSYGIGKLAIEKYLYLYQHLYNLNYCSIRAANPYGPGQDHFKGQGIIGNIIHKIKNHQPIEIWGDGSVVRDYLDVNDLSELIIQMINSNSVGVFNAGSGIGTSINELLHIIKNISHANPLVFYKEKRDFDVSTVILNSSSAKNAFKWDTKIDLATGIKNYLGKG